MLRYIGGRCLHYDVDIDHQYIELQRVSDELFASVVPFFHDTSLYMRMDIKRLHPFSWTGASDHFDIYFQQ